MDTIYIQNFASVPSPSIPSSRSRHVRRQGEQYPRQKQHRRSIHPRQCFSRNKTNFYWRLPFKCCRIEIFRMYHSLSMIFRLLSGSCQISLWIPFYLRFVMLNESLLSTSSSRSFIHGYIQTNIFVVLTVVVVVVVIGHFVCLFLKWIYICVYHSSTDQRTLVQFVSDLHRHR